MLNHVDINSGPLAFLWLRPLLGQFSKGTLITQRWVLTFSPSHILIYTHFLCTEQLTRLTLGVTVRRLVDWAGVLFGVSIEDVTEGGAAGTGRHLAIHTIGG